VLADFREIVVPPPFERKLNAIARLSRSPRPFGLIAAPAHPAMSDGLTACADPLRWRGRDRSSGIHEGNPKALFLTDDAAAASSPLRRATGCTAPSACCFEASAKTAARPAASFFCWRHPISSTLHIRPTLLEEIIAKTKREFGLW